MTEEENLIGKLTNFTETCCLNYDIILIDKLVTYCSIFRIDDDSTCGVILSPCLNRIQQQFDLPSRDNQLASLS